MTQTLPVCRDPEDALARIAAPEEDSSVLPRTVIVVAHPDDETLALGARLARFGDACFVHVMDGAPLDGNDARAHGFGSLQEYRNARSQELKAAFELAGISPEKLVALGIPDQEAAYNLLLLTSELTRIFSRLSPEVLLTHAYEGGHPDHDACAFAVHHAASLESRRPILIEAPFYHAGTRGMETESFLPAQPGTTSALTLCQVLTAAERARKQQRLACFTSQREVLAAFPLERELFRIAPLYDFTQPPGPGPALYDSYPWGIKSPQFRELAAAAHAQLLAGATPCL